MVRVCICGRSIPGNCKVLSGEEIKSAVYGAIHGAANFAMHPLFDLHAGSLYSGDLELSREEIGDLLDSIDASSQGRAQAVDDWIQELFGVDRSHGVYQAFRSGTTTGLELGSLAAAGYGALRGGAALVKGVMAFNKLPKMPVQISKIANKVRKPNLQKIDNAVKAIEEFLGGKGKIITNFDGDIVLMKGNRKIRFDIKDPHGDLPHFHLERTNPKGKWIDAGPEHRYYFTEK